MSENNTDNAGMYRCVCGAGPFETPEGGKQHVEEDHLGRWNFPADAIEKIPEDEEECTKQDTLVTDGGQKEGLYQKYHVEKDGETVENCFVLEPEDDEAAREAIYEYAKVTDDLKLAAELRGWMHAVEEAVEQ